MLKPLFVSLFLCSLVATAHSEPANAQSLGQRYYPSNRIWRSHDYPDAVLRYGRPDDDRLSGFRQPTTVIIIQQYPRVYDYPTSNCSTSVIGSPIPLPYARDSRTGSICR